MEFAKEVEDVLRILDRSKSFVPKDWDFLSNDEDVIAEVYELEYDLKPLSQHLGVNKDVFPPVEQLERDEIKVIVEKIVEVLAAYNYIADLPEGLPIHIAYTALLSIWEEEVMCCPFGNFHFDFYELDLEQYLPPGALKDKDKAVEYPF